VGEAPTTAEIESGLKLAPAARMKTLSFAAPDGTYPPRQKALTLGPTVPPGSRAPLVADDPSPPASRAV